MALKRYVHSVVLGQDGVREDVDSWVAAGGKGVSFADVEIDRAGRMRKRWGITSFTTNALTPPSPLTASLNYGRRLNSVQGELVSYTGKALYGYSETAVKWAHRGEWGSVMTESVGALRDMSSPLKCADLCVMNGYVVVGYGKDDSGSTNVELFAQVYDEANGAVVAREARIATATDAGNGGLRALACGTATVGFAWAETSNVLKYTYTSTTDGFSAWTTVSLTTARLSAFDAIGIGAAGFAYAFYEVGTGDVVIRVADTAGTTVASQTVAFTGTVYGIGLHWDGTNLHMVYYTGGNAVNYRLYNAALTLQASGSVASGITCTYPRCVVTYNSSNLRAFVMWHETATSASVSTLTTTLTKYREVTASTGVVAGNESKTHGHYIATRPVVENGQYHFVLSSDLHTNPAAAGYPAIKDPDGDGVNETSGFSYDGLFIMRMEPLMMASASAAPIPVGVFALGEGFGNDNVFQLCAQNLFAGGTSGTFFSAQGIAVANFQGDAATRQVNVYKHTRDSKGAGKMLPWGSGAVVLGGVPSFYDGVSAYNPASLVKPVILQLASGGTAGDMDAGAVYAVRLVEEWIDAKGNVVLSQPSDAVSIDLTGSDDEIDVSWRSSSIENKRDGFPLLSNLYAQRRMSFYRTEGAGTTYLYEKSVYINKYATDWSLTTLTASDASVEDNPEPYVYGGELANTPLPSCHVGCVSSGRAHLRSDEDKRRLYYSKPLVPTRSVEFDTLASYNMFPEEIVGVADLGGTPCAVSKRHVYVVDGLGPGLAGLPAGAFTVREVASIGTEDQESVIAVPGGVLFRGTDGFYLVGAGGVEPVGDRVQDAADAYGTTICADLDPETRSARFLTTTGSNTRVLVYYWDTKQWVVHTPDMSSGTLASMVAHKGHIYFGNDNGSYGRADGTVFSDEGGYYAGVVKLGWEHVEGVQTRKRFWEVDLLMRRKAAHAVEVKLWYGRDESDADTFYFTEADITTIGTLEKVRVQVPHGRGMTDAIQVQVRDVRLVTPEVGDPYYDAGSGQGFELVAVDYVIGIKGGPVKLAAVRTA